MNTSAARSGSGRLAPALRRAGRAARALAARARGDGGPPYVYESDGLATAWLSPFQHDAEWSRRYETMARDWLVGGYVDVRWRMWVLTELARHADGRGAFAEFGTHRGGCAYMMLACTRASELFMFDTFSGIPAANLTAEERAEGLAGMWSQTSVEHVRRRLQEWPERTRFVAGDVFETLERAETGPLALVHMDLNAAAATTRALEYCLPRLAPGAVIVFDDYGFSGYETQRRAVDGFFAGAAERPIALPTGQAIVLQPA